MQCLSLCSRTGETGAVAERMVGGRSDLIDNQNVM